MQPTMCTRCKKRIAVVFISKMEKGESVNEGLCLKCAKEIGLPQVGEMMRRMGITDEDLDMINDEMMSAFGGAESMEGLIPKEDEEDDSEDGKTATFPFLNRLFGGGSLVGLGLDGLVDGGLDGFAVFALYFHSQLVLNVMLGFFGVFHGLAGLIQDFAFDNLFCLPGFRIGFLCDNVRGLLAIGGRLRGIQGVIDVIDQLLSAAIGRVDDVGLAGFQYFLREGFFGLGRLGRGQGGGGEEAQGQTGGYQPGQNAFFCHHFILLQINFG